MMSRSMRRFSLCSLLCFLPLTSLAQEDVSAPPVSPTNDLIIGSPDAETTLLLYGSPGCMDCVDTMIGLYRSEEIKRHLGAFDLKLVVRHVHPSFLGLDQITMRGREQVAEQTPERAIQFSLGLSNIFACLGKDPGGIDFVLGYGYLWAFTRGGVDQSPGATTFTRWPYLNVNETADFLEGFWQWGDNLRMTEEQIRSCALDPDLQAQVSASLGVTYAELLNRNAGRQPDSFPLMFIDGDLYPWEGTSENSTEALIEAVTDAVTRAAN